MEREQLNKLSKLLDKKEDIKESLEVINSNLKSLEIHSDKSENIYIGRDYISRYMCIEDLKTILKTMQEVVNKEYKEICEECNSYIISKKVD